MIVSPEARDELLAAAAWYDAQREGLGGELLDAVEIALSEIAEAPHSFGGDCFDPRARRALLRRFPYAVVFMLVDDDPLVIAFAHARRRPGYWRARI